LIEKIETEESICFKDLISVEHTKRVAAQAFANILGKLKYSI
jgi:hypothetical protein